MAENRPVMMQATQPFSCSLDKDGRTPFAVGAGDIFAADDEVVRRFPGNFEAIKVRESAAVRRPLPAHPGATEVATAAPGERRAMTRPPVGASRTTKTAAPVTPPTAAAPVSAVPTGDPSEV